MPSIASMPDMIRRVVAPAVNVHKKTKLPSHLPKGVRSKMKKQKVEAKRLGLAK